MENDTQEKTESKKKNGKLKILTKGTIQFKIFWLSVAFLLLGVSILAPVGLSEGSNHILLIVLGSVFVVVYLLIVLLLIWEWWKSAHQITNNGIQDSEKDKILGKETNTPKEKDDWKW